MGWTAADEEEFPDELPPLAGGTETVLPEQRIEGRVPAAAAPPSQSDPDADLDATSVWSDLLGATAAIPGIGGYAEIDRLGRRGARAMRELVADPVAAMSGFGQGGTLGWMDELAGVAMSHPRTGQPGGTSRFGLPSEEAVPYERVRDAVREYDRDAAERSPSAHAAGEIAGTLAPAVFTGGTSLEAEAPGLLATVGRGARTGMVVGGLSGAGESEDTGAALAEETALDALAGGVTGGAVAAVPGAVRALRGRAPAAREAADLARVASIGGGRGTISRESPAVREFARLPGGISGQADRIRRLGLAGLLEGPEGTARRSQDVLDRLLVDGPMVETRRRIAESGAEVPVGDIARRLGEQATDLEGSAVRRPYAQRVRDLIDQFAETYGRPPTTSTGATAVGPRDLGSIPYSRAVEELGDLSQTVPWGSDTMTADVSRGSRAAVRDALDEWVEGQLGPEELARYREGRLDYQTALTAAEQARQRLSSGAGNRGISLSDVTAMSGASDVRSALSRFLLNRFAGTFGPTGRATGREAIARLLESLPEGTAPAELESLAGRGAPDLLRQLRDLLGGSGEGGGGGAISFVPDDQAAPVDDNTGTEGDTSTNADTTPDFGFVPDPDDEEEGRTR